MRFLTALILSLLLIACSNNEADPQTKISETAEEIYSTLCMKIGDDDYVRDSWVFSFDGKGLTILRETYTDSKCTVLDRSETKVYTYETRDSEVAKGAKEIDAKLIDVIRLDNDPEYIKKSNEEKHFGFEDWAVGVPKSIIDRKSKESDEDPWDESGDMKYDLFLKGDGWLCVGNWRNKDADGRPKWLGSVKNTVF